MYCSSCGKEVAEGMQFCPSCGAHLNQTESAKAADNSQDNKLYDVVLIDPGSARIHLVRHLMATYGIDLYGANRMLSSGNCLIAEKLAFEKALEVASQFEAQGAKVDVKENGVPYTPVSFNQSKKAESHPQAQGAENTAHKKKYFTAAILEFVSSALIALACLLAVFAPVLKYTDGNISIFDRALVIMKSMNIANFEASYILKLLPIIAFVYIVIITVRAIITAVKKAIDLTKLEQKYSDSLNAKPETVEQFLKNRKTNLSWNKIFFELLGDFLVFYFASRSIGLVVAPLIIIAVLAVGSLVVKTVSNEASKSANA